MLAELRRAVSRVPGGILRGSVALGVAVVLGLLQAGCGAGWHTTPLAPRAYPARQQAQVWTEGRVMRWHALVIGPIPSAA
ncbi:MAG: hypothetical protein QOH59_1140 [Gemmatimonadales bacterium]|nr:hypothetical protein [Gemmatimonadales bacterium]